MSSQQQPQLSQGNRMYLYRMLKAAIGTGRQTFITQIEDALAADGLAAEDMGFADARALMEALGDMVTLTVFKGGRVYVTLVAQPEWDEALESADDFPKPAGGKSAGKPWKRKKGVRSLEPVGRASFRATRPMSLPIWKPPNPRAPSRRPLWLCRKLL